RYLDVWEGTHQAIRSARDPECPCCGARDFPWLNGSRGTQGAQVVCSGGAVKVPGTGMGSDLPVLAARLEGTVGSLRVAAAFLRFEVDGLDILHFADGRSLVRGTEDAARARAILARTLGG
ncbi:MAG: hypothetical protein ACYSU1_04395, partial [Planctomycetota bacterium]